MPEGLDDAALEAALFPAPPPSRLRRPEPDWGRVHRELHRHKGVTLQLLWLEYRAAHPRGYQYSWFCERYRAWRGQLDVVMRQVYRAGEKVFVDYAGSTVEVMDRQTGEVREAKVFVSKMRGEVSEGPPPRKSSQRAHPNRLVLSRLMGKSQPQGCHATGLCY